MFIIKNYIILLSLRDNNIISNKITIKTITYTHTCISSFLLHVIIIFYVPFGIIFYYYKI
jgi:hypothetical protein